MAIFGFDHEQLQKQSSVFTATEINQQPATWIKTYNQIVSMKEELRDFLAQTTSQPDFDIILTGAGTSEFVGNALYSFLGHNFQNKVKSYGTTDLVASPYNYLNPTKPTLMISFARSGNSPESVASVELANQVCQHIQHIFFTCNVEGALSKLAKQHANILSVDLTEETNDQSFAMTSSYSNMYLACLLALDLDHLEDNKKNLDAVITSANTLLNEQYASLFQFVKDYGFQRIVYLGANTLKGTAQETALKMLELTAGKIVAIHDTPMGFRHGPKSIINDETLTVLYMSDDPYTRSYEMDLLHEMSSQRKKNQILVVTDHADSEVTACANQVINLNQSLTLNNVWLGLDYVLVGQIIALAKSLSLGITPDNPCPTGEVNRVVKGVLIHPLPSQK